MPTRRRRLTALVAAVLVLLLAAPSVAHAEDDPSSERDEVRSDRAQVDDELDALRATDAEVTAALSSLEGQVRQRRSEAAAAEASFEQASEAQAQSERDLAQKEEELADLRRQMRTVAVEAYVHPRGDDWLEAVSHSESLNDTVKANSMLEARSGSLDDLEDQFQAAQTELERARDRAIEARAAADSARQRADARLADVESARASQAQLAADVNQRIDSKLAEAASLEAVDASLSAQIVSQQQQVAEALPQSDDDGGSGGGGGGGGGSSAPSRPSGPPPTITGSGEIVSVGGIRVHQSIAGNVSGLLAAASAAGFNLGGVGYRDSSAQIATRRANCGTSDYAIYHMPSSQCRPPTAPPGTSQHERGLAIDFTANGSLINSRSNPAFQWLAANAGSYGLRNLPSEPWHWSTNGN
jgi:peptidoglycan hydrolase CwlO-like protein